MCMFCDDTAKSFPFPENNHKDAVQAYNGVYKELEKKIDSGLFSLYAGDCPVSEIEYQLEKEIHFSMNHYVKCEKCGRIFHIGFCCRGMPAGKIVNALPSAIAHISWGNCGSFYETRNIPQGRP